MKKSSFYITSLLIILFATNAFALQLDWNGQYWFENHWLNNAQLERGRPATDNDQELINNGGPYVPGTGKRNVVWYSNFLKLKPKAVVNDSINIKSELHIGSPIYGFYGRGFPQDKERMHFTGLQKSSATITAQRYWANLITDFGTMEVGRAPKHWGLGAIWNSGDQLFDHYQDTQDTFRIISKFGNFWLMPSISKVALGNNVSGASDAAGNTIEGDDDVTDIDIAAKYDNPEEDFELGFMWTRRVGSFSQQGIVYNDLGVGGTSVGTNRVGFNIYDIYAKKKTGRYSFGGEFPLFTGNLGALDGDKEFTYKAWALIFEGNFTSDLWDIGLKAGHVPGQPNGDASAGQPAGQRAVSAGDTTFRTVYLNQNYGLGLIMFHYNLWGMARNNPNTVAAISLNSPFDNPIVNANYLALTPQLKLDKWTLKWGIITGWASNTAQKGKNFYNYNRRRFYNAQRDQEKFLGKEFDFGLAFKWDENFTASWDLGLWFPGDYYAFTNNNYNQGMDLKFMFASQFRIGVTF